MERSSGNQTVSVYPISTAWSEKTITGQPGYGAALTNVNSSAFSASAWANFSLPAPAVQSWLTNAASNCGVWIRTALDDPGYGGFHPDRLKAVFVSKEDPVVANHPKLTITYTPPASPNVRPLVAIMSPMDNSVYAPGQGGVVVNASDPDGAITNIQLYAGGVMIGQYTNSPCTNNWSNWLVGDNTLKAVAWDNKGVCSTSAPVIVRMRSTIYSANMDANPGWSFTGSYWAYGKPTGAAEPSDGGGYPDPSMGYTGTNVVGYNLNGFVGAVGTFDYATTPGFDCRNYTNITVEFFGWLGLFEGTANVQVSSNGVNWTTIWTDGSNMSGAGWWFSKLDITAYAYGKSAVYLRWGYGNTPYSSYPFCGWNVDDVRVTGDIEHIFGPRRWVGSPTNQWSLSTVANWGLVSTGQQVDYVNGESLLFDDNASNYVVSVSGTVFPGSMTFSATNNYILQGSGTINIASNLLVQGPGSVRVSNAGAMGSGVWGLVMNGGTLDVYSNSLTVGSLSGSGGIVTSGVAGVPVLVVNQSVATVFGGIIKNGTGTLSLVKTGSGTLTLGGQNAYGGMTTVMGGTLALAGRNRLPTNTAVTVTGGATLDTGVNQQSIGSLALGVNSSDTSAVKLTGDGLNLGSFIVRNNGGLSLKGVATINISGSLPPVGTTNTVVTYTGSISGAGTLQLALSNPRASAILTNNVAAGRIDLIVLDNGALKWVGNGTNRWDLSGVTNWVVPGSGLNAVFTNGDPVVFGDQASNYVVNVVGSVSPGSMTVNSGTNYVIQGGPIVGTATLIKQGSGALTLFGTNSYSGVTVINGGTLRLSSNQFCTGDINVNAGTLELNVNNMSSNSITRASTINVADGASISLLQIRPFGLYANGNAGGLTINLNGGTFYLNATAVNVLGGVAVNLTGASIVGGGVGSRWDLGASGGFNGGITSLASPETSTITAERVYLHPDGGQTNFVFAVAAGTPANGIDLDISSRIVGVGTLVKTGAGVLRLGGGNTYIGETIVSNGTVILDGVLGTNPVSVCSAATLAGTGSMGGSVTVTNGGVLSPGWGSSVGALVVSNKLALASGAVVNMALGMSNDSVSVLGNLALGGTLNIVDAGGFTNGTYTLITYTGNLTGSGLVMGAKPNASYSYGIDTNTPGQVKLVVLSAFEQWQIQQFGCCTNAQCDATADPDHDGLNNWGEYCAGTNPSNALSRLAITNAACQSGSRYVLSWPSAAGRLYSVERCTNLMQSTFMDVATNLSAVVPVNVYTDDFSGIPVFYRIKVSPAP